MDKYKELVFSSLIFIFFEHSEYKRWKINENSKNSCGDIYDQQSENSLSIHMCSRTENRIYQRKPYADHYYGSGSVIWKSVLSPRICQSCMNPDKITIYPLEIEYIGEKVLFTDHYSVKEWKKSDPLPEIHEWYPHIKKARCNPCRNCGRC